MATRKTSEKNTLDVNDVKRWLKNTLIFSLPTLIIVQGYITDWSIGTEVDPKFAMGAVYSSVLCSLIDLGRKFTQSG